MTVLELTKDRLKKRQGLIKSIDACSIPSFRGIQRQKSRFLLIKLNLMKLFHIVFQTNSALTVAGIEPRALNTRSHISTI